jgi:Domain of Unknown Function (DUF1080)
MNKRILLLSVIVTTFSQIVSAQTGSGWTNLFNGKDLTGWKVAGGDATFSVSDNMIVGTAVANTKNTFLITEKTFGDFQLELEVKIEDTAGNAGVQTRSHLDATASDGKGKVYGRQCEVDPSSRKWSGGIYDEGRRDWLYPLQLNHKAQDAFKNGRFNRITIECIGDEMKTWINGVAAAYVVDTIDTEGFIGLQVHAITSAASAGKRVMYKNIRIRTSDLKPLAFSPDVYVVNFKPNYLNDYEKKNGWRLLFDGKTNSGWISAKTGQGFPAKGWEISNGSISVLPAEGKESTNGGDIITKELYSAFDLSFEFKLSPGANSGVKYFVTMKEKSDGSAIGLEYQVLDDSLHPDARLGRDGDRTLASLYDLIRAKKQKRFIRPIGSWNFGRIIVYPDDRVEHYLNGIKVLEYRRGSEEYKKLVAISKYKIWPDFGEAKQGHILLQDHGNQVSFRSIKIKTTF